jgi:dCMP deaminase
MRPSRDTWAMQLATITAGRTTCCRRAVGCVLLNARGHVLATGYNGVAAGLPHCNEPGYAYTSSIDVPGAVVVHGIAVKYAYPHACSGATAPSGTNLDACQAIHAEQNALLQCRDVYAIHTCYVTASPCVTCCKLLLNTGCERIVYAEEYPHSAAKDLWVGAGRLWEHLSV